MAEAVLTFALGYMVFKLGKILSQCDMGGCPKTKPKRVKRLDVHNERMPSFPRWCETGRTKLRKAEGPLAQVPSGRIEPAAWPLAEPTHSQPPDG